MSNYNTLVALDSDEAVPLSGANSNDDTLGKKWNGMSLRWIMVVSLAAVGVVLVALKATNTSTPLDAMMRLQAEGDAVKLGFSTTYLWQSDAGSGANGDLYIWKANNLPSGCKEIATIATNKNKNPGEVPCIFGTENVDFAKPTRYNKKWTDAGSGASLDYSLWEPVCPGGFVALSGAPWLRKSGGNGRSNLHFNEQGVYCVAHKYVSGLREFGFIWNDGGSGANQDGSVWEIDNKFGYWAVGYGNGQPAVNTYKLNAASFPFLVVDEEEEDQVKAHTLVENSQKA